MTERARDNEKRSNATDSECRHFHVLIFLLAVGQVGNLRRVGNPPLETSAIPIYSASIAFIADSYSPSGQSPRCVTAIRPDLSMMSVTGIDDRPPYRGAIFSVATITG